MAEAPQHWKTITGPSSWFRLAHPPHWVGEERDGVYALRPEAGQGLLAINSIWLNADQAQRLPSLNDIVAQFPDSRRVEPLPLKDFDGLVDCRRGEARLDRPATWWQRLWKRPRWRPWTMWAFRRGRLLLVVTLLHSEHRDNELESLTRMVLGTLELPDIPADPPDQFAQRALQLARQKFPLLTSELGEEFHLLLAGSRLNLFNFYRAYVRNPEKFEEILLPALTTVVQVQEWGDTQMEPPLEAVKDRLMPMLYPEEAWQERFPEFVGSSWVGGLAVLYVVDEHNAYWYVRQDLTQKWGLSQDELHEIAVSNLQDYFERKPMEMALAGSEEDEPTLLMPGHPDSYNACRLLSPRFVAKLREVIGGDLVVGIPGRDFFVGVSLKAEAILDHVRERVKEDYKQTDHPLTDRLLLLSADGFSELSPQDL